LSASVVGRASEHLQIPNSKWWAENRGKQKGGQLPRNPLDARWPLQVRDPSVEFLPLTSEKNSKEEGKGPLIKRKKRVVRKSRQLGEEASLL